MPILLLVLALAGSVAHAGSDTTVYVLAAANSESFDRDLPVLRYAHEDLQRFVKVMGSTGLIPADHLVTTQELTRAQLKSAFDTLASRIKKTGKPIGKFIFYYTGHSDANGLHLADGLLRKGELHAWINSIPADTKIAFFDGCYSGALAAKGIKPAADFAIPTAELDQPSGSVYFAATSGTDVAFEVEELRGSLFTHNLVDGLYGAADSNHDGLVTVDELYQYVYKQMASYTAALPVGGGQKPEYRVDLQGRGALVLSYIDQTAVPVEIGPLVTGELTFTSDGGLQVFRVSKSGAAPMNVRLVPGDYSVAVRDGDHLGRGVLHVKGSGTAKLQRNDLVYETAHDLNLVAKGQRPKARFGFGVGVSNSSYAKTGPNVELNASSPAIRIEASEWRLTSLIGGHVNDLAYREQTGKSRSLSALVGATGSFSTGWSLPGQQWRLLLAGGTDYTWQHWDHADDPTTRTFANMLPKIAAGVGTTFMRDSGMLWGVSYRREFPFAKDAKTGDVLAFGANVFALTLEW